MRPLKSLTIIASLAASLAAVACGSNAESDADSSEGAASTPEQQQMLDVNDVSILFSRNPKPFPEITLDEKLGSAGLNLLSQDQFDGVIAFAKTQKIQFSAGGDKRSSWRIFGMRVDPCAPGLSSTGPFGTNGDPKKCKVQVRLIAQPLTSDGKSMQDISAHLVYGLGTLDTVDLKTIRNDLIAIKVASEAANGPTAGQPLGIHPGLATMNKSVGQAVHRFITTHIAKATDMSLAFMGLENDGAEPWIFTAGVIAGPPGTELKNGKFIPLTKTGIIPGLINTPAGTASEIFQPFSSPRLSPMPSKPEQSTAPLFADKPDAESLKSLGFRIEDPTQNHFFSTTCISCHTATSRSVILNTKSNAGRFRVPAGITGYVRPSALQNSVWNVRNFGWFGGQPAVSQRTANESVEIVEFMNKEQAKEGFVGPGNDCTKVDDKVWDCFHANTDGKDGATCMTTNACRPFPIAPPEPPKPGKPGTLDPLPGGDACAAPASESDLTIDTTKGTKVTLSGASAKCLGRPVGSFRSADASVQIVCADAECTVTMPKSPAALSGTDAKRLTDQLTRVSKSASFVAKSKDGKQSLSITCASASCSLTLSQ